jgi:hypothetical protein
MIRCMLPWYDASLTQGSFTAVKIHCNVTMNPLSLRLSLQSVRIAAVTLLVIAGIARQSFSEVVHFRRFLRLYS